MSLFDGVTPEDLAMFLKFLGAIHDQQIDRGWDDGALDGLDRPIDGLFQTRGSIGLLAQRCARMHSKDLRAVESKATFSMPMPLNKTDIGSCVDAGFEFVSRFPACRFNHSIRLGDYGTNHLVLEVTGIMLKPVQHEGIVTVA